MNIIITRNIMKTAPKSPRWSQKRYDKYQELCGDIVTQYRFAVQTHEPITKTFKRVLYRIKRADVTATQRKSLHDKLWATREFVVRSYARWQLYLPLFDEGLQKSNNGADTLMTTHGEFTKWWVAVESEQVSALREAGDANVWQRIHGRMEWHDSRKPFYEDEPPQMLGTQNYGISYRHAQERADLKDRSSEESEGD